MVTAILMRSPIVIRNVLLEIGGKEILIKAEESLAEMFVS